MHETFRKESYKKNKQLSKNNLIHKIVGSILRSQLEIKLI